MTARYAISDTLVLALRALRRIPRNPDLLTAYTVQPIMFTLLFVYVFGGAIQTPGYDDYADFMIPGIIVQQMSFGGFATALGLVDDLKKGLVDRFRSLPMSRSAVLTGRTLSDIAMNALALVVMIVVGYVVGFGFSTSVAGSDRRDRALPADRLRLLLGVRLRRVDGIDARGGERVRLHRDLPAHLRLLGLRAARDDARLAADLRRGHQPVLAHGRRRAGAVRRRARGPTTSFPRSPGASG